MATVPDEPTFLFEPPIVRMATIGAVLGLVTVIAMFTFGALITDSDPWVIGAAGLAAPFGGAGFGAMMGAVLGGLRAAELEAEGRRRAESRPKPPDPARTD